MAVNSTNFFISYIGDGTNRIFPFPFYLWERQDLQVYINGAIQAYSSNYILDGVLDVYGSFQIGGSVVFNLGQAPVAGAVIQLIRATPKTQLFSFVDGGPLEADDLNHCFDKLTLMAQEANMGQYVGSLTNNPAGPSNIGDWYIVVPPIPGGPFGRVCTSSGSPGIWNDFGDISLL